MLGVCVVVRRVSSRAHMHASRVSHSLLLLADISCDVHGSIEFLERTTTIEKPFFQYDPLLEREVSTDVINDNGITVMGVDILPTELARESSEHFGNVLLPVIRQLVAARHAQDPEMQGIDINKLPSGLVGQLSFCDYRQSLWPSFLVMTCSIPFIVVLFCFNSNCYRPILASQQFTAN